MNNKYNLNYFEALDEVNDYLDRIEDDIVSITQNVNLEQYEFIINILKTKYGRLIQQFDEEIDNYLNCEKYQLAFNCLLIVNLIYVLITILSSDIELECLSEYTLECLGDYLAGLTEPELIDNVTQIIEGYENR